MSEDNSGTFRCIGKGACGSVWAQDHGKQLEAIKREDCSPKRSVQNDFDMHRRLLQALKTNRPLTLTLTTICVPECFELIQADNAQWWAERTFPPGYLPCKSLVTERIPAANATARQTLIERFCPTERQNSIKSNISDRDCLIRLYLGRRRHAQRPSNLFTLRNYPLHLDQVEMLGLDTLLVPYAKIMAEALAIMHWAAGIDANDVEFVLASPRSGELENSTFDVPSIGAHAMWVLDFDCCRPITLDEQGVEQACKAFFRNDPYYPRPNPSNHEDQQLWLAFRLHFIQISRSILTSDAAELPEMLMTRIEAECADRRQRQAVAAAAASQEESEGSQTASSGYALRHSALQSM